jgi:hypothetical protein
VGKCVSSLLIDWKVSKRTRHRGSGREYVQLSVQTAVGVDVCEVEEITDLREEELTDK